LKPLRILVTDADTTAGLGAVRSLGRAGHTVIAGCAIDTNEFAFSWSRYCSDYLRYPNPYSHQSKFRDWVCDQASQGAFDVLLPVSESCIVGVAAVRSQIPTGILPILPSDAALEYTLSKFFSTRMALSLGIECPPTVFIFDGQASVKSDNCLLDLNFPIVIKTDNYLNPEGTYEKGRTFIAADIAEANRILDKVIHVGSRIIAQEFIPGSGTGAFLLRFGGKIYLKFAHRRLHEVPYSGGWSSFRESCVDHEVVSLGERILEGIGYEGLAMVEFRRAAKNGKPYFLEINGRLWGSIALALHSDVDFPRALIECYQNGCTAINEGSYRPGIRCRNILPGEVGYLVSVIRAKPCKGVNPPPSKIVALIEFFLLSLNLTVRHDYFWWSDPLPGLYQAIRAATLLTKKIFKRATSKMRELQEERTLAKVKSQHMLKCTRPNYFDYSLKRLMFVCYGNICRSPFAEHYLQSKLRELSLAELIVTSAGFHPRTGRTTPACIAMLAAEIGIDLTKHRSRVVTKGQLAAADAIFVMDRRNYRELVTQFPWANDKTYFLGLFADNDKMEIEDPYDMDKERARTCLQQVIESLDGLLRRVSPYIQSATEFDKKPQSAQPNLEPHAWPNK
jgi:protein-tyrosine-phosphatase/predicted ATP-grasp superfamily ATP-dependent carboligase